MVSYNPILTALDKRIRSSLIYGAWVERNRTLECTAEGCHETVGLEVHHIIDLYHVILGVWKHYGEPEQTYKHVLMYHDNDMLEGICLCQSCHQKRHPLRSSNTFGTVSTDSWCAIPRMLKVIPNHSKINHKPGTIGLIAYQTLLGIGWYILNGHVESRMLTIHRRKFAQLLSKSPGTSFNNSLDVALLQLEHVEVLDAHHRTNNEIELHISQKYLALLSDNPWFISLKDIKTNSMCVLCLRLWLGMQTNRINYCISLEKLKGHIGMTVQHRSNAIRALHKALKQIKWAKMKDKESLEFTLSGRQPTPIRALRSILSDSIEQAK